MSTADAHRPRRRRAAQAGFTFLELSITMLLAALLSLLTERTLTTLHDSERYLAALRLAAERGQTLAYEVRDIAASSRKLFGDDAVGASYMDALDLTARPPAPGARLPLFDEAGPLDRDAVGSPATGNVLLVVRESDPAPCIADPVTRKVLLVDTYRFVCIYPTVHARTVVNGQGRAYDLVIWRSKAYPSKGQIDGITNAAERTRVIADLASRFGYEQAWDSGAEATSAFFDLSPTGVMDAAADPDPLVGEDPDLSQGGRLVYANVQLASTSAQAYARRPVLSQDAPEVWSPHGFELKIVGPSAARTVWLHLVVEAQAGHGRSAVAENTLIASTSDL